MGFYDRLILPRIVDFACGTRPLMRQRRKVVPLARGVVLDLGFGTGRNVGFYDDDRVDRVLALDPARAMWDLAADVVESSPVRIEYLEAPGEQIPLDDASVDTVLVTYTLCTIPDPDSAMSEARRVLKADGALIFCEHGKAPDEGVRRWQERVNPIWKRLGGGCNLDRPIDSIISSNGFRIDELSTMYLPGWKPANFNYWGTAVPDTPPSERPASTASD